MLAGNLPCCSPSFQAPRLLSAPAHLCMRVGVEPVVGGGLEQAGLRIEALAHHLWWVRKQRVSRMRGVSSEVWKAALKGQQTKA